MGDDIVMILEDAVREPVIARQTFPGGSVPASAAAGTSG
ncbi:hypothetical protein SF83666_a43290 (plasmid) [Sinorhizobium fredii CCBAU 83666]|nr:hypothetical protein SF83666_a43290 [Sinorhizobium fredii CCBAU 83666]